MLVREYKESGIPRISELFLDRTEQETSKPDLDHLFVDSSIIAKPFFVSKGFTIVREQKKKYRELLFT